MVWNNSFFVLVWLLFVFVCKLFCLVYPCVNMLVSFSELLPFAHGLGRFFAGPLPNWPKASRGRGPSEGKSACCWSWVSHGVVIDTDILIYGILIPKWSLHRVWVFKTCLKRLYVYDSVCLFYFAIHSGIKKANLLVGIFNATERTCLCQWYTVLRGPCMSDASCYVGVCTFVVVYVCRYMYIWALIYIYTHMYFLYMNTWRMPLHMAD